MSAFLWPAANAPSWRTTLKKGVSQDDLERHLQLLYPGTHPVVTSTGRAAISITLQALGLGRTARVSVPPFSSHCIYSAIGETCVPVPGEIATPFDAHLVYHQWGFIHRSGPNGIVIEDSVDSLITDPGGLFPNDGEAEIVSFSKLLGTSMGAVVFCRTPLLAEQIRRVRDGRITMMRPQQILRWLSFRFPATYVQWHHAESSAGPLPPTASREILDALARLDDLSADRQKKLEFVHDRVPSLAAPSAGRLPVALPVPCSAGAAKPLADLGLTSGLRNFNAALDQSTWDLRKVCPLPLHQDIPLSLLEKACAVLNKFPCDDAARSLRTSIMLI